MRTLLKFYRNESHRLHIAVTCSHISGIAKLMKSFTANLAKWRFVCTIHSNSFWVSGAFHKITCAVQCSQTHKTVMKSISSSLRAVGVSCGASYKYPSPAAFQCWRFPDAGVSCAPAAPISTPEVKNRTAIIHRAAWVKLGSSYRSSWNP